MIHKKFGEIPAPGELQEIDRALLDAIAAGFDEVGDLIRHHRQKAALAAAMRLVGEANKYVADTEPFKLKAPEERERLATVLWTLAQAVADLMRGTSVGVREGHERACRAAREVGFLPHVRGNLLGTSVPPHPSVHAGMPVVGVFFDRQR